MINIARRLKRGCGIFVITVSLGSVSGCGGNANVQRTVQQAPMAYNDLAQFQIVCSRKKEQIEFLQSMRVTNDDLRLWYYIRNWLTPWEAVTDPEARYNRAMIAQGYYNDRINQNLMSYQLVCH